MAQRESDCSICGAVFLYRNKGPKPRYCSEGCRQEGKRKIKRNSYAKHRDKNRAKVAEWRERNPGYARSYYLENRAKELERSKLFHQRNPGYYKERYAKNRDKLRQQARRRYREAPQRERDRSKQWRERNPDKLRGYCAKRRAVKKGAFVELVIREVVLERDEWTCGICGGEIPKGLKWPHPLSPQIDHITPLSEGGKEEYANVQAAHASCNMQKGARLDGWQDIKPIVDGEENHYHS